MYDVLSMQCTLIPLTMHAHNDCTTMLEILERFNPISPAFLPFTKGTKVRVNPSKSSSLRSCLNLVHSLSPLNMKKQSINHSTVYINFMSLENSSPVIKAFNPSIYYKTCWIKLLHFCCLTQKSMQTFISLWWE
jgi:hypothetical protein